MAQKHPKQATTERTITQRGKRVYVDYLQNLPGKTVASAYSVRANQFAGVSAPLRWEELEQGVRPEDLSMSTIDGRVKEVGDLWVLLSTSPGVDLHGAVQ